MAESSRTGFPARNPEYPEGATRQSGRGTENPLPGMPSGENLLPARTTGGRLNRSAERLGRSVGSVLCGLSSVPNRFGAARSRLHVVSSRTRQNASAAAFEMMDGAAQRAADWRESAGAWLSKVTDRADRNWTRFADEARNRFQHLQDATAHTLENARVQARQQYTNTARDVQRWKEDEPLRFLAVVGSAAFVTGVALRIWRSTRD